MPSWAGSGAGWLSGSPPAGGVLWLVVSALVGALVGATTRFVFEDLARPRLVRRRQARALLAEFTTPLMRSAETLERQINGLVRDPDQYATSEYYRLSTLYTFGEYLAWVKLVERRFGFVVVEYSAAGRRLDQCLRGFFAAMSSFRYFRWCDPADAERSAVPRRLFTAMGEMMAAPDVLDFSAFCVRHARDEQFRQWFGELDAFLRSVPDDPFRLDRLILAGAALRALVTELDHSGHVGGGRGPANLDRIPHPQVRAALTEERR